MAEYRRARFERESTESRAEFTSMCARPAVAEYRRARFERERERALNQELNSPRCVQGQRWLNTEERGLERERALNQELNSPRCVQGQRWLNTEERGLREREHSIKS